VTDDLIVNIGAAQLPGYDVSWRESVNELSTAEFKVKLDESKDEPVDYLAPVQVMIEGDDAWDGTVVKALPDGDVVRIDCTRAVIVTETLAGVMASEECPHMDLAYAFARSMGLRRDRIVIGDIEKLPLETMEIVVAVRDVEVPGKRAVGPVTLVPATVGREVLKAFKRGQPDPLREAFDEADCFAIVIKTKTRLWDAEQEALADVDAALNWLAVRARYGAAMLPNGTAQRYERSITRVLPRRGAAMAIRGLGTGRRWLRDPATLIDRPLLELDDLYGQLFPSMPRELGASDRFALAAAARAFDGDPIQRIVALWEAWEFYAKRASMEKPFEKNELDRLREDLPKWLNDTQRERLSEVIDDVLNAYPLRKRLRTALDQEGVPFSEAEMKALWKLRTPRNKSAHGKATREVEEEELQRACSLLCRALVSSLSTDGRQ
jgi:hypothetical protein